MLELDFNALAELFGYFTLDGDLRPRHSIPLFYYIPSENDTL